MFKNPIWQEATRCLFSSPTKGLNSGLPRNHASQRSERNWNSVSTNLGRGWTRLGIDRSWLQELQCKSHACAKHSTSLPARWDVGDMIDLPTSWSRFLYEREARAVDFFMFSAEKTSERASFALGPTTGTGNEKQRTLRKSKNMTMDQNMPCYFLELYKVLETSP